MFKELNEQLMKTKEQLREKNRLEKVLTEARKKLAEEKDKLKKLEAELEKEREDVRKLEGLTLTAMFHHVLGSKDQKLNEEKQEFLAAKLKYDLCKHAAAALNKEILFREQQIRGLGNPELEYASILEQKESLVLKTEEQELRVLSDRLADLNADIKEIIEARDAGKAVLNELEKVITAFKSASNWGVADLIGGGLIMTAVKHSKIDKAKTAVHTVQHLLGQFQRELSDLDIRPESQLGIEISSFQTFADYIFDGLIFDWIVQSKINKSLANARRMKDNISLILNNLQDQIETKNQKRQSLHEEKKNWLEKMC